MTSLRDEVIFWLFGAAGIAGTLLLFCRVAMSSELQRHLLLNALAVSLLIALIRRLWPAIA
jgi:hypothetical protein